MIDHTSPRTRDSKIARQEASGRIADKNEGVIEACVRPSSVVDEGVS